MNIDAESIALLSLILRDAPQDRQFILCVLARSNQVPGQIKFHSNTEYPTFYGYSNERMPYFLMGKGVLSNVPREGSAKRLISSYYLSYAETVINKAKNWDIHQKLWSVSKFITLDNNTTYKDAEVFLVFRNKAQDFIRDYVNQNRGKISPFLTSKIGRFEFGGKLLNQKDESSEHKIAMPNSTAEWSEDFKWQGNKQFVFGEYGVVNFNSQLRIDLFRELTKAKGSWVTVKKLKEITGKDDSFVRPTIGQIERSMKADLKRFISFPSTGEDDLQPKPSQGAYRIKFSPKSL